MRRVLLLLMLLLLPLSFGCARNHFNVPEENYASRVRVLGVAPIIIDEESDIRYPQREQLISLVAQANRACEQRIVGALKETGNYYSVSLLESDPRSILPNMLFRRERRDDASIQYNKYFWKSDELRDYIRKNNLDAVMLIVVSGLTKSDKAYSSARLSSLTGEYNYLIMTAQILDANGTVLWEYPNFRGRIRSPEPLLALQYPDFSEAEANLSEKPEIKFKTIEGIRRILNEKRKDFLRRETRESVVYARQFDEMASLLEYDLPRDGKTAALPERSRPVNESPAPAPVATPQAKPARVEAPAVLPEAKPAMAAAPAVKTPAPPVPSVAEPKPLAAPVDDTAALEEIVPAAEDGK
jgi:hypothetical protein